MLALKVDRNPLGGHGSGPRCRFRSDWHCDCWSPCRTALQIGDGTTGHRGPGDRSGPVPGHDPGPALRGQMRRDVLQGQDVWLRAPLQRSGSGEHRSDRCDEASAVFVVTDILPEYTDHWMYIEWLGCYILLADVWLKEEKVEFLNGV